MLGKQIKEVIKSRGLTLQEVGNLCGMKKSNVSRALNNNRVKALHIIAEALNLEIIIKDRSIYTHSK